MKGKLREIIKDLGLTVLNSASKLRFRLKKIGNTQTERAVFIMITNKLVSIDQLVTWFYK